jgi:hypothetical protein
VLGAFLPAQRAGATDWVLGNRATNPPPLKAEVKYIAGPDLMPVNRAFVRWGTNKFTFLMPDGYRLDMSATQKVMLVSTDLSCLISWRILGPAPSDAADLDPAQYRELVLSRHPGARMLNEFSLNALGRYGPVFDLRWGGAGGLMRRERVLFIPALAGVLEFSLVSSPEKFDAGREKFDGLRLSFRASDANGKLAVPTMSNKF